MGSNPSDCLDVVPSMFCMLCRMRYLRRADHSFRGVLMDVSECVCVCMCVCVCVCVCVSDCVSCRKLNSESI